MSQTFDVNMEGWPIAPEGYIPNSLICGRRKKRKHLPQSDDVFSGVRREDGGEEKTGDVRAREKESEDEEEEQRTVLLKESYVVRSDVEPRRQGLGSGSRETVSSDPILRHAKENRQHGEQREEPPLQRHRRTSTFTTDVETPVVSAEDVLSEREPRITSYIPPREPQNLSLDPPKPPSPTPVNPQPQPDRGPHHLKPPSPTPVNPQPQPDLGPHTLKPPSPTPVNPQPQPDLGPHTLKHPFPTPVNPQPQPDLGPHPLKPPFPTPVNPQPQPDLGPHPLKPPFPTPVNPQPQPDLGPHTLKPPFPTPVNPQPQPDLGPHTLKHPSPTPVNAQPQPDLGPPEISPIGSTKYNIVNQTQVPVDRRVLELYKKSKADKKNFPRFGNISVITEPPLASPHSTVQSNSAGLKSEWRKNLHNPLEGFSSPPAVPSLWPGEGAVHQRVVQRILMKDTLDPPSFHFHHVIPLNAQQTVFPLNRRGKTRYGRLQFDWVRGGDKGQLWSRPSKLRSALYDLTRST